MILLGLSLLTVTFLVYKFVYPHYRYIKIVTGLKKRAEQITNNVDNLSREEWLFEMECLEYDIKYYETTLNKSNKSLDNKDN